MNESPTPGAGAPLKPSWPKTPHDALPVPGGKTLGEVPSDDLTRLLVDLQVPGVSHANGRLDNANAYAKHVANMREEAAARAIAAFVGREN